MRDYDATVKNLREAAKGLLFDAMPYRASVMKDAADAIEELLATARSVVHCKDCEWWTKQDASIQGRCARFGFYPTGKFYCASGSMAEPPKGVE
jgi:hypothetical protein